MNEKRRKAIAEVVKNLQKFADSLEASAKSASPTLEQLEEDCSDIRDEEQEYFDNMPESLQISEKGSAAEEAVDQLRQASTNIEEARDKLSEVLELLRNDAVDALDEAAGG